MAVRPNTIVTDDVVHALDQDFVERFDHEFDRLAVLLGELNPVEVVTAGTAMYQYRVTGELVNEAIEPGSTLYAKTTDTAVVTGKTYYTKGTDGTYTAVASPSTASIGDYYVAYAAQGASSGTAYREGDFIQRSHFKVEKVHIGDVEFAPYAKQTTAQAILKSGFENAIGKTDRKALRQIRGDIMTKFFGHLANGTTVCAPATGGTYNLQQLLAFMSASLGDVLETNGDEGEGVYFINRQDAATYLGNATISTQEAFGLTYLADFLGVRNVFLTNKVTAGTAYATPIDNIHIFGLDFGALGGTGLEFETSESGLIGVHHKANYDYASAETVLVRSANFVPEVLDFIVKGSMTPVV